jgi:hypothetical protein
VRFPDQPFSYLYNTGGVVAVHIRPRNGKGQVALRTWLCPITSDVCELLVICGQKLGADEAVDYSTQQVDQLYADKPFDVVIDPIGGETAKLHLSHSPLECFC